MGAHEVPDLQHNGSELLVIPSYRRSLAQVKQVGLVAQGMVQIMEFSFKGMAEILPRTHTLSCPILVSY